MRVLVEALAAEFGGIRTYVDELLAAWAEVEEDEVHVLIARDSTLAPPAAITRHHVDVRRPAALGRPWAQTTGLRDVVRRTRPDVVLATLPSTTLLDPGVPVAVVVYDLRHELRPEQFTRGQRLKRAVSYGRGYQLADLLVCISRRTLDDLVRRHPRAARTPTTVVHLGADHALRWPRRADGPAIAFGHHTNKNPDLVLDAWRLLSDRVADVPGLTITGVSGARRAAFEESVARRGLPGGVELAPFLDESEFESLFGSARLVVFPSDFEGFGLPVVEAMTLGTPVVIGPEPATREVSGGHAFEARDWSAEALATAVEQALRASPAALAAARDHAATMTWAHTVTRTRAALSSLLP